jgi:hypothetical protein
MSASPTPSLEDVVIAVYSAIDDALANAGITSHGGKLINRPGNAPKVDDREILCLALLQELMGFESDNHFHLWLAANRTMQSLFPERLSRQNFADRRALLTPILERLCGAICQLMGEGNPPFSSLTATPWTSAARFVPRRESASADSPRRAAATHSCGGSTE